MANRRTVTWTVSPIPCSLPAGHFSPAPPASLSGPPPIQTGRLSGRKHAPPAAKHRGDLRPRVPQEGGQGMAGMGPAQGRPPGAPDRAEVERLLESFGRHISSSLLRLYRFMGLDTLEWDGEGAICRDAEGREYLDFVGANGTLFLGRRHPRVTAAVREQLDRLTISSRLFAHEPQIRLAEKLAEIAPGDLQYTFFCNSGAEAVEGALKLARAATGRTEIISTQGAFHGKTFGALSATGRELYRKPFEPLLPGFVHVPYGDADAVEAVISDRTAAVIVEPIQGENGVIIPPDDYLPRLRQLCDRHGALLIIDEVQAGLG